MEGYEATWTAMAQGITQGQGLKPFITYHPMGGSSSSASLHKAEWLSMNMMQSGHCLVDTPNWEMIRADYALQPVKPALDGEPNYEDHPIDPYMRPWRVEYGRFDAYDVRKQAYRAVFAGACGHTYGHHSVWQMWSRERQPVTFAMPPWEEAILRPGAQQMIHLKNLMLSHPYLSRIPGQDLLVDLAPTPPVAGQDDRVNPARAMYPVATRCAQGTYGLVYFPLAEQSLQVDVSLLNGPVRAWWYDPRNGRSHFAGDHPNEITSFTSPIAGPDWVLVLDATT